MNVRWMNDQFGLFFVLDLFDRLVIFGFFFRGLQYQIWEFGMEWTADGSSIKLESS